MSHIKHKFQFQQKTAHANSKISAHAESDRVEFIKGYEVITEEIKAYTKYDKLFISEEAGSIPLNACLLNNKVKILAENPQAWKKMYEQENLFELAGFTEEAIVSFYALSIALFDQKKYDDSLKVLTFLSILNPSIPSFLMGKGLCYESLLDYDKAIDQYEKAIELEATNFDPFLALIRCSQQMKDYRKVMGILDEHKNNPAIKSEVAKAIQYIKTK